MIKSIESISDVDRIRDHLKGTPRDLLLFDLATQTGCKMQQALKMKVRDMLSCQVGEPIYSRRNQLGGGNPLIMTRRLYQTFGNYVQKTKPVEDDYIFKSRKGADPLTPTSASRLIRGWFEKAGLNGLSGYSSLQKTWELLFFKRVSGNQREAEQYLDTVLTPVAINTRQETVYRKLQEAILLGEIPPGTRLKNDQIAALFHVSDTPVREALARLRAEGFVTRAAHKGYVVHQLTSEDLDEIVRIRVNLECMAAKEASKRITDEDIKRLSKLQVPEGHVNQDLKAYFRFNKLFHKSIYKTANMPTLMSIIENLWDKMSPYFNLLAKEIAEENPDLNWEYHTRIIEGFKLRDPEYVCKAVSDDITNFASHIIEKMKLPMD